MGKSNRRKKEQADKAKRRTEQSGAESRYARKKREQHEQAKLDREVEEKIEGHNFFDI